MPPIFPLNWVCFWISIFECDEVLYVGKFAFKSRFILLKDIYLYVSLVHAVRFYLDIFFIMLVFEQNLLLSTNDSNAVLKIADFGFAR